MKLRNLFIAALIVAALLLPPLIITQADLGYRLPQTLLKGAKYQTGEVIVKYKPTRKQRLALKKKSKKAVKNTPDFKVIKLSAGESVRAALKKLRKKKTVEYAEPNYLRQITRQFKPNDPWFWPAQWGLYNHGQLVWGSYGVRDADTDLTEAWSIERGTKRRIIVAVIDTGIDTGHPDLVNKLWRNRKEIPHNNKDDDKNGYIDDFYGYNFAGISQNYLDSVYFLGKQVDDLTSTYAYQSITGTGGYLSQLSLRLAKTGRPSGDVRVALRSSLDGAELAAFTIKQWEIGDYSDESSVTTITKNFSSKVKLTDGQTYYLYLSTTAASDSNYYTIGFNSGEATEDTESSSKSFSTKLSDAATDPYVEGKFKYWEGTDWVEGEDLDMFFQTNHTSNPHDDNGHGTHVSGIVGAQTNNNIGVAGACPGARIMSIKAGSSTGIFQSTNVARAIYYAIKNKASIINLSLGGSGQTATERRAIKAAIDAGILVVAAAGNSGDSTIYYPCGYDGVLGVGATTNTDEIASFSTHNSVVDVSAPGRAIISTTPTYNVSFNIYNNYSLGYDFMDGTSMATPFVSGIGAVLKSRRPSLRGRKLGLAIQYISDDLGTKGRDDYYGFGRVNSYKAIRGDRGNPTTPVITSSTHPSQSKTYTKNTVTYNWSAKDRSGIAGYSYVFNQSAGTIPNKTIDARGTSRTFTGVANGRSYLHVRAVDSFGHWGKTSHRSVYIDAYKPRTSAPSASSARFNRQATLSYRVDDPYTSKALVIIKIKYGKSSFLKIFNLGYVPVNQLRGHSFKCDLPAGNYQFLVYATDKSGNKQYNVASNTLSVSW
ncbi:MAG: hypothetical protein C4562_00075 [Actinobacteria bacterium]|nr:MAG: hypothetical protein C4562_00075 [Actinomycetota bacterium]